MSPSGPPSSPRYESENTPNTATKSWESFVANRYGFQALEGKDVKDLLSNVGSGGGAAAPAAGGAADAPAEEAKEEEKEESDEDMGFGLFD